MVGREENRAEPGRCCISGPGRGSGGGPDHRLNVTPTSSVYFSLSILVGIGPEGEYLWGRSVFAEAGTMGYPAQGRTIKEGELNAAIVESVWLAASRRRWAI